MRATKRPSWEIATVPRGGLTSNHASIPLDALTHSSTDIRPPPPPPPVFLAVCRPKHDRPTKPGKVHVESFDGVGDGDATPMASPIKRYDGDSSPKKAKHREEEDSAESDVLLDKPPADRGSPKRSSVGSPRSRSPRRQVRPDNDYSDREENASDNDDDGRAKNRSVVASPRSRNRRGRSGKGEEGDDNDDDDEDAARAAPRSDRDNSISGSEPEGKRWKTSGRSAPSGGTRTHKSPRESSPTRSRETSPKASRKGYDYDDEGEDGEGDNGASPRNRKGGRKGDWESQVARSNAVKSQPRRRKPTADSSSARSRRRGNRDDEEDDEDD